MAVKKPIRKPAHSKHGTTKSLIEAKFDAAMQLWVRGFSFERIAAELYEGKISAARLNEMITKSNDFSDRYAAAKLERAQALVEQAVDWAYSAAATGEPSGLKVGIDTVFKAAGFLDPDKYSDKKKVELTGKDGGPIKTESMSDDDLLKIAAGSAQ